MCVWGEIWVTPIYLQSFLLVLHTDITPCGVFHVTVRQIKWDSTTSKVKTYIILYTVFAKPLSLRIFLNYLYYTYQKLVKYLKRPEKYCHIVMYCFIYHRIGPLVWVSGEILPIKSVYYMQLNNQKMLLCNWFSWGLSHVLQFSEHSSPLTGSVQGPLLCFFYSHPQ